MKKCENCGNEYVFGDNDYGYCEYCDRENSDIDCDRLRFVPDSDGVWRYKPLDLDVDVYYLPTGHLCVWCEDVGIGRIDQSNWATHEWLGHIPVHWLDDDWQCDKPSNWELVRAAV